MLFAIKKKFLLMKKKYFLILLSSLALYNLIMFTIDQGFLFKGDSHARYFYIVYAPYYFVLMLMSMFFRYKILTLIFIIPISFLVWKIGNTLLGNEPGSVNITLLFMMSQTLLIIINELLFFIKKTWKE